LIVIDAQERFRGAVENMDATGARIALLAKAAARLEVPALVSEQYPKALGLTLEDIRCSLPPDTQAIEKMTFSCADVPEWAAKLQGFTRGAKRDQLVICGVEAHVCVLQTALDLAQNADAAVYVVEDAVSSRRASDKQAALRRLESHGVQVVTAEMVIFEWLRKAGTQEFKDLQPYFK
jgi:nicotinamidase-related amidase